MSISRSAGPVLACVAVLMLVRIPTLAEAQTFTPEQQDAIAQQLYNNTPQSPPNYSPAALDLIEKEQQLAQQSVRGRIAQRFARVKSLLTHPITKLSISGLTAGVWIKVAGTLNSEYIHLFGAGRGVKLTQTCHSPGSANFGHVPTYASDGCFTVIAPQSVLIPSGTGPHTQLWPEYEEGSSNCQDFKGQDFGDALFRADAYGHTGWAGCPVIGFRYFPAEKLPIESRNAPPPGVTPSRTFTAPPDPGLSAVRDGLPAFFADPENAEIRDWYLWAVGTPGATNPYTGEVNLPAPATAPGEGADVYIQELEQLGLTNVTVRVLSGSEMDPAFNEGAAVRVSPPPGTSVEPDGTVEVIANRTTQRPNNGECDRAPHIDPDPAGVHGAFEPYGAQSFDAYNPGSSSVEDVPFRYGVPQDNWGYRHVSIGHGWDDTDDRRDTTLALVDPAPEQNAPYANAFRYYHFYLQPNRIPCTRRVVVQFGTVGTETLTRGIITSFAYPGWYRKNDFL